jgi:hypothetical protein
MPILIFALVVVVLVLFSYITKWCRNPYKLYAIIGGKGSGKTMYQAKIGSKYCGIVYSNIGIGQPLQDEYWNQEFEPESLILIDEVGVLHSNRNFKSFPQEAVEWYKMQRKRKLRVILSSQNMDFDKKIRDMCDFLCVAKRFGFIVVVQKYKSTVELVRDIETGGYRLTDTEKAAGILSIFTIPKTSKTVVYDTDQLITVKDQKKAP